MLFINGKLDVWYDLSITSLKNPNVKVWNSNGHHAESFIKPDKKDFKTIMSFINDVNGEGKSYTGIIILCSVVGGGALILGIMFLVCYLKKKRYYTKIN